MTAFTQEDTQQLQNQTLQLIKNINNGLPSKDMDLLVKLLHFHEYSYYVKDAPLISDGEYDILYNNLLSLEKEFPDQIVEHSPTKRVAIDIISEFKTVPHLSPMLSLANSYNAEDLMDFDRQVKKWSGIEEQLSVQYSLEPKFDGGTICLVYEDDILIRAATRGNGTFGEEMTNNAFKIRSIPLSADFSRYGIKKVELRGEALISLSTFKAINAKRQLEGLEVLANPRNAATGALRVKDSREVSQRGLEAFVYQISYIEWIGAPRPLSLHSESIQILQNLGFKTPDTSTIVCDGIQDVIKKCNFWQEQRDNYPYEIDGMVVKVDHLNIQEKIGYTTHHPRWAMAFKFKAKQATSILLIIEYQIGKIGSITPVAKIEPTPLAGVIVSSISLHNEDFIKSKDIRIGDQILIERAGDVIPYIVKSFPELRKGHEKTIEFPTNCPSCKSILVRNESEVAWRCDNTLCPAQNLQRIIHHASKDAMDIEGLGKSIIERFNELGLIKDISDIYNLNYDAIANLEGFGLKSIEKLKLAIEKAKQNPIQRLLFSLSIPLLGQKAGKTLAKYVNNVFEFCNWSEDDFLKIKDIGPVLTKSLLDFFNNSQQLDLLKKLEKLGVNMNQTKEDEEKVIDPLSSPLVGKTILFTGSLSIDRKEAEKIAELKGAKNLSSVSKNLNILVVGENAGSKLTKAKEIGTIEIWTEQDFVEKTNN